MADPLTTPPGAGYPPLRGTDDKTLVIVVYVLYLVGFITAGLTTLVGLIMAYALKGNAGERAFSHYVFLIRTFWLALLWLLIACAIFVVGLPLAIILIGIPLLLLAKLIWALTALWFLVRCIVGLIAAAGDQPYARPRAWII